MRKVWNVDIGIINEKMNMKKDVNKEPINQESDKCINIGIVCSLVKWIRKLPKKIVDIKKSKYIISSNYFGNFLSEVWII